MSTMSDLLARHSKLSAEAVEHLQRVVAEWQLLADMSFADFLIWIPLAGADGVWAEEFLCVAQVRPTTAPTAHPEDAVTARVGALLNPQLRRAVVEGADLPRGAPALAPGGARSGGRRSRSGTAGRSSRCWPGTPTWPCPGCPARWRSPT